jgi:hypothetical protein
LDEARRRRKRAAPQVGPDDVIKRAVPQAGPDDVIKRAAPRAGPDDVIKRAAPQAGPDDVIMYGNQRGCGARNAPLWSRQGFFRRAE